MRSVNQQQLARRLRLSRTTVSRSLSNHPAISAETRERVLAAAAQVGYKASPTRAVRRPRQSKPLTVGVLIGSPLVATDTATFPAILAGMRRRAAVEHIHLDVLSANPAELTSAQGRKQLFRQIRAAGWRGVVLVYPFPTDAVEMIAKKLTVVSVLTEYPELPLDVIDTDHGGVRALVSDLAAHGHERIGFLTWHYAVGGLWALRRFGAFIEATASAGLELNPDWWLNVHAARTKVTDSQALAEQVATRVRDDGVTAWVCAADHQAYQLISDLRTLGLDVPTDCSVTGFDGNPPPPGLPRVTTVSVPNEELGSSTIARLVSRLLQPRSTRRAILVETTFAAGQSVGAVPASSPIHHG